MQPGGVVNTAAFQIASLSLARRKYDFSLWSFRVALLAKAASGRRAAGAQKMLLHFHDEQRSVTSTNCRRIQCESKKSPLRFSDIFFQNG